MYKIPAPNYTQTPNIFFDEIFKTLKEGELRIVLVIMRQTFGWHKPCDRISLSQLSEKTGMNRTSVCRSLNSLINKRLIEKHKIGELGEEKCYYTLVTEVVEPEVIKDDDGIETQEESDLISKSLYQSPKETRPVSLGDPTSLFRRPTKETITKEKTTVLSLGAKKPPSPAETSDLETSEKVHPDGHTFSISKENIYKESILQRKKWSKKLIEEAWEIYKSYNGPIRDWFRYIEGTIENLQKKQDSKAKKCHKHPVEEKSSSMSMSDPNNDYYLDGDMRERPLAKFDYLLRSNL